MSLLKISFIISLLGILILLILSSILEPSLTNIREIDSKYLNKKVKIQGEIINMKSYNTKTNEIFQVLEIKDGTGYIEVILSSKKETPLRKNQKITVIGIVNLYKNSLQIQAHKIF